MVRMFGQYLYGFRFELQLKRLPLLAEKRASLSAHKKVIWLIA
jgi:hypothetical protein